MLTFWILFNVFVAAMLILDLGVFHRGSSEMTFKKAVLGSLFWISLAIAFAILVYFWQGHQKALEFGTGYLIEESLSVDNLFVFLVLFNYFKVPQRHQYTVLFWGIIGALIMRFIFIFAGVSLINRFHWIIYIFGVILIYSGMKLAFGDDSEVDPGKNPILKLFRKFVPITDQYEGGKFLVRKNHRTFATPLLAVLIVVETTDLLFAVDSIPAVLAISRDPFIVYTSNVFAILGLRAIYFALSGMFELFHYLHYGLSAILVFVGSKMLLSNEGATLFGISLHYEMPTVVALGVVGGLLTLSIVASLAFPEKKKSTEPA
ncbi:MAG: integral rane protein TerC [Acidobacteriales bacterium]|nr:integral rane protein TerC [Terriglobales bacterium]